MESGETNFMKEKILTVAIPAYNMELYLKQCLDSLLVENKDSLEIIVVDDGSEDLTGEISRQYAEKYPDIIYSFHKSNEGWGSAINYAIQKATGKYFRILDSDDWFQKEAFAHFLKQLESITADMILSRSAEVHMEDLRKHPLPYEGCGFEEQIVSFSDVWNKKKMRFQLPNITYRTEILKRNNIKIDTCYYADLEWASIPIQWVKTIYCLENEVYMYRIGRDGQSCSKKMLAKHVEDIRKVTFTLAEITRNNNQNIEQKQYLEMIAKYSISAYFRQVCAIQESQKRKEYMVKAKSDYEQLLGINPNFKGSIYYSKLARIIIISRFKCFPFMALIWGKTH